MKELTCEMCGSRDIAEDDESYVCRACGARFSIENAEHAASHEMVEVGETVRIGGSDEIDNLYELAEMARDVGIYEHAVAYYNEILVKSPRSWRAQFYVVYLEVKGCGVDEIIKATANMVNIIPYVFDLISNDVDCAQHEEILAELTDRGLSLSREMYDAAQEFFEHQPSLFDAAYSPKHYSRITNIMDMLFIYGDMVIFKFGEEYSKFAVEVWKQAIFFFEDDKTAENYKSRDGTPEMYRNKISMYDASCE